MMRGVFAEMRSIGFPDEVLGEIKKSVDAELCFFGSEVREWTMFAILAGSVVLFTGLFILLHVFSKKKRNA